MIAVVTCLSLSQIPNAAVAQPAERDVANVEVVGSRPTGRSCASARRALAYYRAAYVRWGKQRGALLHLQALRANSCERIRYLQERWRGRARAARRAFEAWFSRTYEKWRCIHEREAAWDDEDAPHYGGLQFDDDFQRTYGTEFLRRWGDAGNWPVWAQLLTAERGFRARGIRSWPNTARACGLL